MKLPHILLFAFVLGLGAYPAQEKQKADETKTAKISIHFMEWNSRTFAPITCEALPDSILVTDSAVVEQFDAILASTYRSTALGMNNVDVRICCTYQNEKDSVTQHVTFGLSAMSVNDSVYTLDPEFLDLVVSCIPGYSLKP